MSTAAPCPHTAPYRSGRRPSLIRRGRGPAVERSGTNALGVRRPISAAALSFRASAHTGMGIRFPVGRDPCVPPRSTHCSRRGTRAPPYRVRRSHGADRVVRPYTFCAGRRTPRAFVPLRSTAGRRPLRTLSLRASPRREASTLGVQTAAAIRFPSARPLDKPVGMGIIVDVRGRCDKRSAPVSENFNEPYGSQKPSLVGVAVFVFQLHNTNRNGIPPDVESKYPVHVCHPLSGL